MAGRVGGRGGVVPPDATVAVGAAEHGWPYGRCAVVVTVSAAGPVRVNYAMTEPAGPMWLRQVPVRGRRRRRVLAAALGCGVLDGAGTRWVNEGTQDALHGWLHVAASGRSRVVHFPQNGRIGGAALRDLMLDLVPGGVWKDLHARRDEAWAAWAQHARGDARSLAVEGTLTDPTVRDMEATLPDPASAGGAEATLRDPGARGPVGGDTGDVHVAGWEGPGGRLARGGPDEGRPGIWHGGGRGGVW
ncbi:hypothetical protein [Actinomadura sp. 9N407]|uniref:hypothetical protein n=1 Tax=Actinomadura sp. 9N407 TaxID=3375154 RepID=UPI0037AB410B